MKDRLPVSVVTGFLGAGKTTLLRRVLRDPRWADSAVVVNEFGEVPLDHELVAAGDETYLSVATGCLCCAVRTDLGRTLLDLHARRAAGAVPRYARVLVETSGLADPAPLLHALVLDEAAAATHALRSVATLVDAVHGGEALDRHPEAQRQVLLADRIVLTKPDAADPAPLRARLAALNPSAPVREALHGDVPPDWLFAPGAHAADPAALAGWLAEAGVRARHTPNVAAIAIERDAPLPATALTLWMQGLAEHAGARLLRLKGLVAVAEAGADRPAALHAIQHVVHPLEWLDRWPPADRRSRIVLIGQGIPRHWPARLLAAVEAEVAEEAARRG